MQDFRILDALQHQTQEFQQRMDEIELEFQQSLERTEDEIEQFQRESSPPSEAENVWHIVTLSFAIFLMLTVLGIREHRTKQRRQRVANQTAAIVAMVWDEIDPEEIRRDIDEFQFDRAYTETFKAAMMISPNETLCVTMRACL